MDHLRDSYRERRNNNFTSFHDSRSDRSTRGSHHERSSNINDYDDSKTTRTSFNEQSIHRMGRISLNSRPISSRNGPPKYSRPQYNDDSYPSSSFNRTNNRQFHNHDDRQASTRIDRSVNSRERYSPSLNEQSLLSNNPPSTSMRGRNLPHVSSPYTHSDRGRYRSSFTNYRTRSPPSLSRSSRRSEHSTNSLSQNMNTDVYMRSEYRPTPPPSSTSAPRNSAYDATRRTNQYDTRSERYSMSSNRNATSSRNYSASTAPSSAATYSGSSHRSSSNVSMSSVSSYNTREKYIEDNNYYRPTSPSRNIESSSSRDRHTSPMVNQEDFFRNARHRDYDDYHSRPNLKRSNLRYDDNGQPPSKRPTRR